MKKIIDKLIDMYKEEVRECLRLENKKLSAQLRMSKEERDGRYPIPEHVDHYRKEGYTHAMMDIIQMLIDYYAIGEL